MNQQTPLLGFWGWLGIIIVACLFFFQWLPTWTWRPVAPEIQVNDSIFEAHPKWDGDVATITRDYSSGIYIRVTPENAVDARAGLSVTVNGQTVDANCSYSANHFCHKISAADGAQPYEVIARNTAGERKITIKVITNTATDAASDEKPNEIQTPSDQAPQSSAPNETQQPSATPAPSQTTVPPYVKTNGCLHYEAGRCWDEIEEEIYSEGLYDHNYGYYGASISYPDDCDSTCQDIIDDAYDEGWYDD